MPGICLTPTGMARFGVASIAALTLVSSLHAQEKPHHVLIDARSAVRRISANDPETKIERAEKALAAHVRAFADHSAEAGPGQAA